jgi:hypothetical protein
MTHLVTKADTNLSRFNQLSLGEYSPEKAGVGGSIPSLATTTNL